MRVIFLTALTGNLIIFIFVISHQFVITIGISEIL
jgi:hypothetical protein